MAIAGLGLGPPRRGSDSPAVMSTEQKGAFGKTDEAARTAGRGLAAVGVYVNRVAGTNLQGGTSGSRQ